MLGSRIDISIHAHSGSIPLRLGSPHSTPSPPSGNGKASRPSQEQRTLQTNTPPPPPPGRKASVRVDARHAHCHQLAQSLSSSRLRRRTGVHWSNTCGRHSKPPRSMSVHTNPLGTPLHLNVDPRATPVNVHKAASVPVHWENTVKEHLDRDVRLGVLEKVPVGTPDT